MSHLHYAARTGNCKDVAACLQQGDDVDAVGIRGLTPLIVASHEGHLEVVRLLISAGANVNECTNHWGSALHHGSSGGHLPVVRELVQSGADLELVSRYGDTPVIGAAHFGRIDVVEFLRDAGADMNARGKDGVSAQEWVERGGIFRWNETRFPNTVGRYKKGAERPAAQQRSEEAVARMMSEGLSADEYAAKHGRFILVFGYGLDRFNDPEVDAWVQRLYQIIRDPDLLAECEDRYLGSDGLVKVHELRARRAAREARRTARKERESSSS